MLTVQLSKEILEKINKLNSFRTVKTSNKDMYAYAYRYFCLLVFVRVPYLTVNDADPDPGLGAFSTPGSRDGRKSASGSGIRNEQPGSYFLELRNHFFAFLELKYLNSLMRIRDPGWRQFGSGMEKKSDPG